MWGLAQASWAVTALWGVAPPSPAQYAAGGWVLLALLALSWPVPDPMGQALPVYAQCALRIRELFRQRLGELNGALYSGSGSA
jgi:hypothetical protein